MDIVAPPTPASTGFDSDFYVAAATIIPVLFIALAVQVPLFVRVFVGYQGFARIHLGERTISVLDRGGLVYKAIFRVSSWLLVFLLIPIVVAGGLGELLAFYALYQQQAQSSTRQLVFLLTAVLIFGVPAVAVATFGGGVSIARTPKVDGRAADEDARKQERVSDAELGVARTRTTPDEGTDDSDAQ